MHARFTLFLLILFPCDGSKSKSGIRKRQESLLTHVNINTRHPLYKCLRTGSTVIKILLKKSYYSYTCVP